MAGPGPHPDPPDDLQTRHIEIVELSESLFRSHSLQHNPVFFGRSGSNRFDAPDGSYGVMYAGCDPFVAFIETFGHMTGTRIVTTAALEQRGLAQIYADRPLQLVDLTSSGTLARLGADARLFAGDHDVAQRWSIALRRLTPAIDGLLYPSRLDPARSSVAVFEDSHLRFYIKQDRRWYRRNEKEDLLATILDNYGFELIETRVVPPKKPPQGSLF